MRIVDVSSIQDIPGYVEILKFVLKSQIQNLVEQLQDHAGEETLVLSANLTAGTLSHLESDRGQGFLDMREDIKSQFLTHCLQGKQKYHTAVPPGHKVSGHRVAGSPHPNTAEPQVHRVPGLQPVELHGHRAPGVVPAAETPHHKDAGLKQLNHSKSIKLSSAGLPHTASNRVSQSESVGLHHTGTSRVSQSESTGSHCKGTNKMTEISSAGIPHDLFESGTNKLIEQKSTALPQTCTNTLTQSVSTGSQPYNKRTCLDDVNRLSPPNINRLPLPGDNRMSEQPLTNNFTIHSPGKLNDHLLASTQQNDTEDNAANQNSKVSTFLPGPLTNLPTVNQSLSEHLTNLPTINQSAVKDLMSLSYSAQVLPQFMPPLQTNITPMKLIDENQFNASTLKSSQVSSFIYPETLSNFLGSQKSSPSKTTPVTNIPYHENMVGCKTTASITVLQQNSYSASNCLQDISVKQDIRPSAKEQINKTTKRKQKRSSRSKPLSKTVSMQDSAIKKPRILEPEFSQNHILTPDVTMTTSVHSKDITNVHSVTPLLTNLSTPNVPNTPGFSLLKMQPVVLIDDPNQGARKIFIESGSVDNPFSGSKTTPENSKSLLVEPNGHLTNIASVSNRQMHTLDVKEKDKTKKTLSSKIDEITQRITKDDAIKQHTVQTSDCDQGGDSIACSVTSRFTSAGNHGNIDSLNNESSSHDVSTPPSLEHLNDGDPSKLKDGSRASHRKPKLPRFNIGVASDDEDNAEAAESPSVVSPETSTQAAANISPFGIPQSSVNISHDDAQDIINIQVSGEDSETSFPHINLEELADGLLLTDIPIVSYYNNVEDSSKSLIESVFNLKPGRDPSTKKPLNSQSIIVSGSKLEKDWVKCPLCPDKFLTVEALQYHIKNVNHVAKKYECDLCKRKFSQLRDMERHRRIHTGERPFTCDICNKSFSRKDNLKSHARKHSVK